MSGEPWSSAAATIPTRSACPVRPIICELKDGEISRGVLTPEQFGLPRAELAAISGGTPAENAHLVEAILNGQAGAPRDIVLLNAAATLYVAGVADSIADGLALARQSIDSGAARQKLAAAPAIPRKPEGR